MSAIIPWWRERLRARCPLSASFMIDQFDGYNFKRRTGEGADIWPARVARQALYQDYQSWHENMVKAAFTSSGQDRDGPLYASELVFYNTMSPFLYIHDKKAMVKNYHVKEQQLFEGRWIKVQVRRYFIILGEYQEHLEAFARETGSKV